jgi:hypothetical protein
MKMRLDDPVDHYGWGERLVKSRTLDGFRAYGAEVGLLEFAKAWNHFTFSRDARQLALIPKKIKGLSEETFDHNLRNGLQLSHFKWSWEDPARAVSARERNAWQNGFIEAYTETLDDHVSGIIPPEIEDKLELFCSIVGAIQQDIEQGSDPSDWGVRLGARKKEPEPKIHPKKDALIKKARAQGLYDAKLRWMWQTEGNTYISRPMMVSTPHDWELSPQEQALYEEVFEETFMGYVKEQIQKIAPPKVWKNAFLICSLFDEMQAQKYGNRRMGAEHRWQYLRYLRDRDFFRTEAQKKQEEAAFQKKYYRPRGEAAPAGMGSSLGAFISRKVQMTPGARKAFEETGDNPEKFLDRHFSEDFGESPAEDLDMNRHGAKTGGMVMSIYSLSNGTTIWIITDDGHEMTTLLLPEEY